MFTLCSLQVELTVPVNNVHFDLTSVLSTLAQNAVIMETRGLTRCLLSETTTKSGEKQTLLNTEGINMHEIFKHSDVRLQTETILWDFCHTFLTTTGEAEITSCPTRILFFLFDL